MNRFSANFLRNSNTKGNFSNKMWNFDLKLCLIRSENGVFEATFQNVGNTVVSYCIHVVFLTFGCVIMKDLFIVLVYQLDINILYGEIS